MRSHSKQRGARIQRQIITGTALVEKKSDIIFLWGQTGRERSIYSSVNPDSLDLSLTHADTNFSHNIIESAVVTVSTFTLWRPFAPAMYLELSSL